MFNIVVGELQNQNFGQKQFGPINTRFLFINFKVPQQIMMGFADVVTFMFPNGQPLILNYYYLKRFLF